MKFKINKKIRVILAVFTLLLIILNILPLNSIILQRESISKIMDSDNIHTSGEIRIESDFSSQESWESHIEGDDRDISTAISQGHANYVIIGDSGNTNIDNALSDTDWTVFNNPELPILPDIYEINSSGCYVYHQWHEDINQTRNRPSIHWKRTINMPVNMTDYIITSASLEVIFNATVTVEPRTGGGIDRLGDPLGANDDYSTGDYAEFYVLFSDVEESFEPIQAAYNNTALGDLGQDDPAVGNFSDTPMNAVPENVLKSILKSVLETDGFNFTITLGIDIYCEDNEYGVDIDRWNSLIIRSFNLTFSYEKKIDQFTAASWNQIGEELENSTNIQLNDASLEFDYKVDRQWPFLSSPNSEIRILINDKQYIETIKLRTAPITFDKAEFDVTSLITKGIDISLAIQVFLADTFELADNLTVSIDNVLLVIDYTDLSGKSTEEPFIFRVLFIIALIVAAGLGGYLYLYQKILKYPKPVRKVRKYRFSLKKKKGPDVTIVGRERAFNAIYAGELSNTSSFLKVKPKEQVIEPTPKTASGASSKKPQGIKSTEKS